MHQDFGKLQRSGMRRWGRRNAWGYPLWAGLLALSGYRRMIREVVGTLDRDGTVVDVGCGSGEALGVLARERAAVRVYATDLSPEFFPEAARRHPGAALFAADAERLPIASGSCDAALSLGVLGHLLETTAALRELARVVRPGGIIAIWTRTDGWLSRRIASAFERTNRGVAFRLHRVEQVRNDLDHHRVAIRREGPIAGGHLWIGVVEGTGAGR